jgi:cephalosporin-C deacetylase
MCGVPSIDMGLPELLAYRPEISEPADFDQFWQSTLAEADEHPLAARFDPVDTGLRLIRTFDVSFAGAGGHPIRGWLHLPADRPGPLPAVVQYLGYSGGRGLAHESTLWAQAGYAQLIMDTRGQGWGSLGASPDPVGAGTGVPGAMTRGIEDPHQYYYRRVYVDAARAVAVARSHDAIDADRVVVAGGSQGGGLTLAAASLVPGLAGAMADVPFLSHFRRAVQITPRAPYTEIAAYLQLHRDATETVFRTLSYFDVAALCRRATAPALFSIGLLDDICPPSTCFAAYHNYGAHCGPGEDGTSEVRKDLKVYEFNNHEGGAGFHQREQLRWLSELLPAG